VLGHAIVVCAGPDDLGKGGHECSLVNGNSGAAVATGDILRTESQQPKQGSAMRSKFLTQASSRMLQVKSDYAKRDEADDEDPWKNQTEEPPLE
jgi:hypothetical protein